MPKNIGAYVDFSYGFSSSNKNVNEQVNDQDYIFHLGLSYKLNNCFRPFVGLGMRFNKHSDYYEVHNVVDQFWDSFVKMTTPIVMHLAPYILCEFAELQN